MTLLGRIIGRLMYRVEVHGLEHLPAAGATLVLVKHQRNSDIPLGFAHVLTRRRPDNWCVMKHDLAAPQFGGFVMKAGGIPIDRDAPMRSRPYFRMAREVLHDGRLLVLFPEQTFFVNTMGPGKVAGFRYLTKHTSVPIQVVNVGLAYYPRGFLRSTRAVLQLGPPRIFEPATSRSQVAQAEFLHECMHEIARLTALEYPHGPAGRESRRARRVS